MRLTRAQLLRIAIGLIWLIALLSAYWWFEASGIELRQVPRALKGIVRSYGAWGPIAIVCLFALRSFVFLPTTPLVLVAGSLFGPFWGFALTVIGNNLSANISFVLGRFFGRRYVKDSGRGLLKKYDEILTRDGFMTVLLMRLLYIPFDVVNLSSGISGIPYRQYLVATFIGLMPEAIMFSVLGNAFINPRGFLVFGVLLLLTLLAVWLLKRSKVVKRILLEPQSHESIFEKI
jgi:uncharacterized membrane protein YdjX (TVP38/TMEM64 family)